MPVDHQQRYDNAKPSYIKVNDKRFADLPAGTTVLIPSPQDIEAAIVAAVEAVPPGSTVTLTELRHRLAETHGAVGTCPVMTGMNLRVVAEVAFDALDAGVPAAEVVPVWMAIDPEGKLASKLPGGQARLASLRIV